MPKFGVYSRKLLTTTGWTDLKAWPESIAERQQGYDQRYRQ